LSASTRDIAFMRAALALALRGLGRTAPNPSVAALVVDERVFPPVVLGRGLTAPQGRPHAEDQAIAQAGEAARGATIYITLEPCAERSQRWFGPSCTERILQSGIARVVIAAADPSPFAHGAGAKRLRAAGVEVVEGVLAEEAGHLNRGHCTRVRLGRPYTYLKLARTADGFACTPEAKAIAITGGQTQAHVHRMRSASDALITGIGTVLGDDPQLDCRLPGMSAFSPLRVVLDTQARMPAGARLLQTAAQNPVVIATAAPEALLARLGQREGVEVLAVPRGAEGHLDLSALLAVLGTRGITRAMVEAGPTLAEAFAAAALLDEVTLLTGPGLAGAGMVAVRPALEEWLARATRVEARTIEADGLERFERNP
jgi:diaminohydroxyphosphoribosylaminopyrimidine deaminase / 5-amino-6-(5-phosphoribosylamino)uracil reductase